MQHSNSHTIKFISIMAITVSLLLSITSTQLNSLQQKNIEIDMKKNILKSIGVDISVMSADKIIDLYSTIIDEVVIDMIGNIVDVPISSLTSTENKSTGQIQYKFENKRYLPGYLSNDSSAFIIPISGKGLWSTLYGYFALSSKDYNTVKGITFYKHGETPGLGAEVDKDWFQNQFNENNGRKIFNKNNELVSISVVKGPIKDRIHEVDGISGATITSNGVTDFLLRELMNYKAFFLK